MLADRPYMAEGIEVGDELWMRAVQGFRGLDPKRPIYWNNEPPKPGYEADHQIPTGGQRGFVRIRATGTGAAAFEAGWCALVYELSSARLSHEYIGIFNRALAGELTRSQWIELNTRVEFKAIQDTRSFYMVVWKPWCERKSKATTPSMWFVGAGETYEQWIRQYIDPEGYPENFWGTYYDDNIATWLVAQRAAGRRAPEDG